MQVEIGGGRWSTRLSADDFELVSKCFNDYTNAVGNTSTVRLIDQATDDVFRQVIPIQRW